MSSEPDQIAEEMAHHAAHYHDYGLDMAHTFDLWHTAYVNQATELAALRVKVAELDKSAQTITELKERIDIATRLAEQMPSQDRGAKWDTYTKLLKCLKGYL